ncbi:acyclic terpene utilization AtuA family protein [Saccharopolyspora hattusasensis]|uniref:acyclic terpene utilization AtuA family protein n=1 Tax=Saccharopolyspora hattusasensis TaxID=1128679 RepID=UPI003D95B3DF
MRHQLRQAERRPPGAAGADVVTTRLRGTGLRIRADALGAFGESGELADECRLRVAAMAPDPEAADVVCHEVEALYTNGPAGGGGVRADVREVIGIVSALIPRSGVETRVTVLEVDGAAA